MYKRQNFRGANLKGVNFTGAMLKNTDFVICLNKTIYDYLTKLSGGKQLVPQNTLYQPILEFEDWCITNQIQGAFCCGHHYIINKILRSF